MLLAFDVKSTVIPDVSLPDRELLDFLEEGPAWLPKPYKIPIEQGSKLDSENLQQLEPGLSKEQVKFLLGTPSIVDAFHENRWDYIYYDRDGANISRPQRITVIFKNEKVA